MYIFLNERNAPSVDKQPTVILDAWRVVETAAGQRRILAQMPGGSFRITSPLAAFDCWQRTATTSSGRVYEFAQAPTEDEFIRAAFAANAARPGLSNATDVSLQLWAEVQAARH